TPFAVEGSLPARLADCRVRLTLERTAGSPSAGLEPLPKEPGPARDRVMRANHDRANRFVLSEVTVSAASTRFAASLAVPADLRRAGLVVRAYAATDRADGQGVLGLAGVR